MAQWYSDGQWDVDAVRVLFARCRARSFFGSSFSVFGLDSWTLPAPCPEGAVAAFEAEITVELPGEFRDFLLQVGDGGPGPAYGVWPLTGRPEGHGTFGRSVKRCAEVFDHDDSFPTVDHGDMSPDDEEYWDDATYIDVPGGVLDIATYGDVYDVYLVLAGEHRGELWVNNDESFDPLDADDADEAGPAARVSFASWYSSWLDRLAADDRQLDEVDLSDPRVASMMREIGRLGHERPAEASASLCALLDEDDAGEGVHACALRMLGRVDAPAALERARGRLDRPEGPLEETAFDVFTALAGEEDLPRLRLLIEREGAHAMIPVTQPRRVQLDQAVYRINTDAAREMMGDIALSELLGRRATAEDVEQMRSEMLRWKESGDRSPPADATMLEAAGFGVPSPDQAGEFLEQMKLQGEEFRQQVEELMGGEVDWAAMQRRPFPISEHALAEMPPEARELLDATRAAFAGTADSDQLHSADPTD